MLIGTKYSYKLVKSNIITLSENIVCSIEQYGLVDRCSDMRPKKFYLFLEAGITDTLLVHNLICFADKQVVVFPVDVVSNVCIFL